MGVNVYLGKQTAEKVKATQLIDAGATDFNVEENITALESEVFTDLTAKGDSTVGKIEVNGSIPIELSKKVFEELMPGISYKKGTDDYKMSTDKPAFYTVILTDTDNNEKWEYVDCVISKLDINIAIGGYVKSTIEVIGESLRCLFSNINLGGTDISTDIEGADISIDNGVEAKGSLNSLYNVKIRRTKQVDTKVTIQKNEYEKNSFKDFKEKMIAGTPVTATIKLGDSSHNDLIVIEAPKLFINSNKRGDYKGSGSHNIDLQASVNNTEKSHLKITFKD